MQTPQILQSLFARLRPLVSAVTQIEDGGQAATEFTPTNLVAGTVVIGRRADARDAAYYQASVALDTERLRLVHVVSPDGRRVNYLAAPAADFGSAGESTSTPLTEALANDGEDGAWFATDAAGRTVVVTRRAGALSSYTGRPERAARFAGALPVFRPGMRQSYPRWVGRHEAETRLPRRILAIASLIQGAVAVALLLAATMLFLPSSRHNEAILSKIALVRTQDEEAVRRVLATQSNLTPLRELERLAGFQARNTGRIVNFKADATSIEWVFMAPATLGRAQISDLGDVRVTEEGSQLRIVRTGNAQ